MPYYDYNARKLIDVALGKKEAELVIRDGLLADVYTGRMLPHRSVAISDGRIAYVGPDASHAIGEKTKVIEAGERVISPGYIDAHTHMSNFCNISDFLKYAIPGGTTTFVTEVENYTLGGGAEGFRVFLDQVRDQAVKIFCLIPPLVSVSPGVNRICISGEEARELLRDELVLGIGESYWQNIVRTDDNRVLELARETLAARKSVQGHAAGAFDKKLAAYAAIGAVSCHEAISAEDVLFRLELGYYAMIREGFIRHDVEILLPLVEENIDLRRAILVTDGTEPVELVRRGYMTNVVQKAVDIGVKPISAIQMASLNPATHLGLDHLTGGISPGRLGDILLLPRDNVMQPDMVISEGRIVAENGETIIPLARKPYSRNLLNTVNIPLISASELSVPVSADASEYVRTMDIQSGGLVTKEGKGKARIISEAYCAAPENDLLKIVFIERVSGKGERFVGFVRGWGQKRGAVGTTLCWDSSGIIAVGTDDDDLAAVINRIIENQGGLTIAEEGELSFDLPFPVGGYISEMKIEDIAEKLEEFQEKISNLGVSPESPFLTLCTLTTAAIPFIRMSEKGYFRFRENDIVGIRAD